MGSWTAQALAGQRFNGSPRFVDRRFIAAIGFSPSALTRDDPATSFGGVTIPFFSITGSEDGVPPVRANTDPAKRATQQAAARADRSAPFAGMPPGGKYLLVFDGADHMAFAGTPKRAGTAPHVVELTLSATTAFWGAALQANARDAAYLKTGLRNQLAPGDQFEAK
jgi:hypothetical protein